MLGDARRCDYQVSYLSRCAFRLHDRSPSSCAKRFVILSEAICHPEPHPVILSTSEGSFLKRRRRWDCAFDRESDGNAIGNTFRGKSP